MLDRRFAQKGKEEMKNQEMLKHVLGIIEKEKLSLFYEKYDNSYSNIQEGYYDAENKSIHIASFHKNGVHECLVIAHEIGHYFDVIERPDLSISEFDRENAANNYMLKLAKSYDLENDAIKLAKYRMKDYK